MERIPVQLPSVTLASVTQLVLIYPRVPAFLPWVGVTYLWVGVTYLWVGVTYLRGCSGKLFLLTA